MQRTLIAGLLVALFATGCVTQKDLQDMNTEFHRSVIRTLSEHERAYQTPFTAYGQVVAVTERDVRSEMISAGFVTMVDYRIALIEKRDLVAPTPASVETNGLNYVVHSQGFHADEKVTQKYKVGDRFILTGYCHPYPNKQ
ncbi:MAG: hypothetical protein FJ225_12715 [Lentisphaerae bacterium]|nr:hypothetical protein [Lentisphaerota bacterium]